ncbi:MAG: hypothetical protein Q9227_000756 [Pyrenula ochraceoflavens]
MSTNHLPSLTLLATISHPSSSASHRAWYTSPHPTLPLLATATSSRSALISSLTTFTPLSTVSGGHKRSVRHVSWKPPIPGHPSSSATTTTAVVDSSDTVLATASFDSTIGIWRHQPPSQNLDADHDHADGEDGEEEGDPWSFTALLTGHSSEVKSALFHPSNPSLLATCSRDKSVWIWEEVSGEDDWETVAVLEEHSGDVKCLAWLPNADPSHNAEEQDGDDGDEGWEGEGEGECLVSGSYDETVRVWRVVEDGEEEWGCVACFGEEEGMGTVWCVDFEKPPRRRRHRPSSSPSSTTPPPTHNGNQPQDPTPQQRRKRPRKPLRLATATHDHRIRIWRRQSQPPNKPPQQTPSSSSSHYYSKTSSKKIPSTILPPPPEPETWHLEALLPPLHACPVYAVSWSGGSSGLLASCGGDGVVGVYRERGFEEEEEEGGKGKGKEEGKWEVVAVIEDAHGEYEVNHVCWASRWDQGQNVDQRGRRRKGHTEEGEGEGEEVLVTTGDDGSVRVWEVPEGI